MNEHHNWFSRVWDALTALGGVYYATGLFGAVASSFLWPNKGLGTRLAYVVIGWAIAWNGTPLLVNFYKLPESQAGGIGFFLGLFGMVVSHSLFSWLRGGGISAWLGGPRKG